MYSSVLATESEDAIVRGDVPAPVDWYAIRVRPRSEQVVSFAITQKGYDSFLPLGRKRRQWSDRTKEIELPLFPGYVFCRADIDGKPSLLRTPNVIGLLSFAGRPAIVANQEIEAIKQAILSGLNAEPWPHLREGQRVRIRRGALAGLEGLLVRAKSDWRLVLSVEVLCRSVAIEIDRAWAEPA